MQSTTALRCLANWRKALLRPNFGGAQARSHFSYTLPVACALSGGCTSPSTGGTRDGAGTGGVHRRRGIVRSTSRLALARSVALGTFDVIHQKPVVNAIVHFAQVTQHFGEELAQKVIIGRLLKPKLADIVEIDTKLFGESVTQLFNRGALLLLTDLFIFLLVRGGFEALPRQASAKEIQKDMAQSLKVIAARLLAPKMGVDTHVPRSTTKTLAFSVWNMLLCTWIAILLRHAEIDDIHDIR